MIPDLPEALALLEILCVTALLVLIFLGVNKLALAAADAVNRRRR